MIFSIHFRSDGITVYLIYLCLALFSVLVVQKVKSSRRSLVFVFNYVLIIIFLKYIPMFLYFILGEKIPKINKDQSKTVIIAYLEIAKQNKINSYNK